MRRDVAKHVPLPETSKSRGGNKCCKIRCWRTPPPGTPRAGTAQACPTTVEASSARRAKLYVRGKHCYRRFPSTFLCVSRSEWHKFPDLTPRPKPLPSPPAAPNHGPAPLLCCRQPARAGCTTRVQPGPLFCNKAARLLAHCKVPKGFGGPGHQARSQWRGWHMVFPERGPRRSTERGGMGAIALCPSSSLVHSRQGTSTITGPLAGHNRRRSNLSQRPQDQDPRKPGSNLISKP